MAKKPTFQMLQRGTQPREQAFSPLIFCAGTQVHKLALHRTSRAHEWIVSDPKSGAKILTVRDTYKGVPVSSKGVAEGLARVLAIGDLEGLVNRIGSERFNAVLANPQPF